MQYNPSRFAFLALAFAIVAQFSAHAERVNSTIYPTGQAWLPEIRERFYFTPQGSKIIPYTWAMALKTADNRLPFFSSENLKKYGYIPQKPSAMNQDGLPVGFMKDTSPGGFTRLNAITQNVHSFESMPQLGINCAACHVSELSYQGRKIRIEGGPSYSNFQMFTKEMDEAIDLVATQNNEGEANYARFVQFAGRVGGDIASLRNSLTEFNSQRQQWQANNGQVKAGIVYGPARNDAFGVIFNQTLGVFLNKPENIRAPNAPVKYPMLWDAPYHEQVQWVGIARNNKDAGGPIARNIGQVLGVFGHSDVYDPSLDKGYCTSAKRAELNQLEEWVRSLRSPTWPKEIFGFNPALAEKGQAHYQKYCVSCHQMNERNAEEAAAHMRALGISNFAVSKAESQPERKANEQMWNISVIKTDETTALNAYSRTALSGPLEGRKVRVVMGREMEKVEPGATVLRHVVAGSILGSFSYITCANTPRDQQANIGLGMKIMEKVLGFTKADTDPGNFEARMHEFETELARYKARPLNGIWAAPPYLHNGSVRSLMQLLTAPTQREPGFEFTCNEFDPVNVGLNCDASVVSERNRLSGDFNYDTTLAGNAKSGHDYGTRLTRDEKLELIEFLKAL